MAAQLLHAVGELYLVVAAGSSVLQNVEYRGGEHVAAEDGEVRELLLKRRLLVHVADLVHALGKLLDELDGGILRDKLVRYLAHRDGAAVVGLGGLDKLLENGLLAEHDIVAEEHRERLVADEALRAPYGVAETLRLLLAQEEHVRHVRDCADGRGLVALAVMDQALLKVGRVVEIVLDGVLAAVGDYEYLLNARGHRLLDDVLNDRLIHQRKHFLRDALGVREQARTKTGGGDYRFSDLHIRLLSFLAFGLVV